MLSRDHNTGGNAICPVLMLLVLDILDTTGLPLIA